LLSEIKGLRDQSCFIEFIHFSLTVRTLETSAKKKMLKILCLVVVVVAVCGQEEKLIEQPAARAEGVEKECSGDLGEGICVPYYLCADGKINTDGSDLLDIRFKEECEDIFERCCPTDEIKSSRVDEPVTTVLPQKCGLRNQKGVLFSIKGNNDNESEFAGERHSCAVFSVDNLSYHSEFPWMLAVLKDEIAEGEIFTVYQCGGSLINPLVALTGMKD